MSLFLKVGFSPIDQLNIRNWLQIMETKKKGRIKMAVTPRGSGICPVCSKNGSLRKCNKCGDERCVKCTAKLLGSGYGTKPCIVCGKK